MPELEAQETAPSVASLDAGSINGDKPAQSDAPSVVALSLSADSTSGAPSGKIKKSSSGRFLKGLLKKKGSSTSLADVELEHTRDGSEAAGPSSEYSGSSAPFGVQEDGKKKKSIFGKLKRKGSTNSLASSAAEHDADASGSHDQDRPKRVGGLLGRLQRLSRDGSHAGSAAADDDEEYAPSSYGDEPEPEPEHEAAAPHHGDGGEIGTALPADAEAEAAEAAAEGHHHAHGDGDGLAGVGVGTAGLGSHEIEAEPSEDGTLSTQHIHGASEYTDAPSTFADDEDDGRLRGAELIGGDDEVPPMEGEKKPEKDGGKGFFGLLGRARSGGLSGILGKPKDEAQLAAEREAAEAAAAAATEAAEREAAAAAAARRRAEPEKEPPIRKFPRGFMWGTATSAYQVEGAYLDEGKGMSIWDAFCHTPGKISGGATADISTCHFYRFKEDVALMKAMGVKYYRMSIAWSRIFPNGKGKVNERGIAFYNRLINELIANRIMPVVTLYHWDLPLALQIEEDGWLNPKIVDHFVKYAKLCFSRFGDRVKYWITMNEPWCAAVLGHDSGGQHAPGRTVDPAREVYKVAHHMLIAHGRTYQMYQRLFKRKQRGKLGLALNGDWYEGKPAADLDEQRRNEKAAERALEFSVGWFARPVYQGDYPTLMRERCGNRLPRFTAEQRAMLVGSADFFGLNHYSSHLCEQPAWYKELAPVEDEAERETKLTKLGAQLERMMTVVTGARSGEPEIQEGELPGEAQPDATKVQLVEDDDEIPADPYVESTGYWQDISVDQSDDDVWKTTDMGWGVFPEGMRKMLNYIQKEYNPRGGIIITENGCAVAEDDVDEALKDIERAVYLKRYLTEVHKALLHDDVDVRGYFVWSLLDNFEWGYGYTKKFGLHYVDMQTLERIPKMSANWFSEVVKKNRLDLM